MTSPLRRKRQTTVRGRSTPTWKATSYAGPLAALAALLAAAAASAQPSLPPPPPSVQRSLPATPIPVSAPMPYGAGLVQPVALQPRQPPPAGDTGLAIEFADILVMPGPNRLFILESEEASRERMINRSRQTKPGERLEFPPSPPLSQQRYAGRSWPQQTTFAEPNYVCYQKLLFEQKNFERYGWDLGPFTPIIGAGAFWVDVALLPYHLGTDPFRNYECSAGYCMPGDPVPLLLYPPELSVCGTLSEGAAVAALVVLFP